MMVWYCGWNTTFKEKLPKTAGEPATGSTPARGMESKNKFFLCMGKKKTQNKPRKPTKNSLGKTTSDYSELLRPGARAWRNKQESVLFPSSQNKRARCRWTTGRRLVRWLHGRVRGLLQQAYADSKLLPLPGGRRRTGDYDSGAFRVVQPPGMLPQLGEPLSHAPPRAPLCTYPPRKQLVQHCALHR